MRGASRRQPTARSAAWFAGALTIGCAAQPAVQDTSAGDGSGGAASSVRGDVEIFSWWTSGGEEEALEALIEVHQERVPGATVTNAAVEYADKAREQLQSRMAAARPPDTFQSNAGADLIGNWVLAGGASDEDSKVENLQGIAEDLGWVDAFDPQVLAAASYDGKLRAVPLNVHRINSLVLREDLFSKHGLEPPESVAELNALCAKIASSPDIQAEAPDGEVMACLGLGNKWEWTLSLLTFEMLLPAMTSADYYHRFWSGEESGDDPEVQAVLDEVLFLYCGGSREGCGEQSYFNADVDDITWDEGVRKLVDGCAMMAPMGDWAKGFLEAEGLEPGKDFEIVPFPGSKGTFVFTSDTFPLPKGAPNRPGALELLKTFASAAGQAAFNHKKGSIPARVDVDMGPFDVVARATIDEFAASKKVLALSGLLASDELADLGTELKASMRRGSTEIIANYVRANYESIRR